MGQIKYLLRYISIWLLAKALLQLKNLGYKPYNLVELIYDEAEWKQYDVAARKLCDKWRKPKKQRSLDKSRSHPSLAKN